MKKRLYTIFTFIACLGLFSANAGDLDTINARITDYYLTTVSYSNTNVGNYLSNQNSDGSWSDVDYASEAWSGWPPLKHIDRLKEMAVAYSSSSSTYYDSSTVLTAISKGIDYWYSLTGDDEPVSGNWWYNIIGKQLNIAPLAFLMQDDLTSPRINYLIGDMATDTGTYTGQNKIWLAQEIIWRGILSNSSTVTTTGVNTLEETIAFTPSEGLQTDYTFYQHGPQLYNGGYGAGFASDSARWAVHLAGTAYAMSAEKINLLSQYMLQGNAWMTCYNTLEYSTTGRAITRPNLTSNTFATACDLLAQVDSTNASMLTALKNHIYGTATNPVTGNKYFEKSHYQAHIRDNYYISLRMDSGATQACETGIGENLKGRWLSFGVNFICLDGSEYYNIMPVWDWARLPGVTNPYFTDTADAGQDTWEVNGISDGECGMSAMELDFAETTGRKAWFFFEDGMLALGSGITSTADEAVGTTVNQCYLDGNVTVNGSTLSSGSHSLSSVYWIHHDSIGYIFPGGASVKVKNQSQSGSWYSINSNQSTATVSEDVFTLWFDHGTTPTNASYQYIVVPDKTASQTSSFSGNSPIEVVSNTTRIQAAIDTDNDLSQIIYYQPGSIRMHSNLTVSCNAPGLVMVDESGSTPVVSMRTLSGVPLTATVSLDYNSGTDWSFSFDLKAVGGRPEYPLTFTPTADAFVQSGTSADNNYGTSTALIAKASTGSGDRKTFLKFSLPEFEKIESAKIRLYCNDIWNNGQSVITANGTSSSWTESGITYNNAPTIGDRLS